MEDIVGIYDVLRKKDKDLVGNIPLENRVILSQLITNSAADSALRFAWANRALAQSNINQSSAIISLGEDVPEEQRLVRKVSKRLREKEKLSNPIEIFNEVGLKEFIENNNSDDIVIKQNYPSDNDEIKRVLKYDFKGKTINIANTKEAYNVIESKKCLAIIAQKDKEWLQEKITEYVKYIIQKNKISLQDNEMEQNCNLMVELVSNFLIPTKTYKGNIEGLYNLVKVLVNENFLPVFKFNYSVSGYGVHYPKTDDGKYDIETLKTKMKDANCFIEYLTQQLNKNGQTISQNEIIKNIEKYGITIQKYISGHEHSIGYFKPLKQVSDKFSLALTEFIVTDVIVEGTAHCGNVLHYNDKYIFDILSKTKFSGKANLLHFCVEIILYLMYLNEKLITKPEEYKNMCVEDFGIQFIVNDETGDVGLIEFNGRTPSCNFNHYHLLSEYGKGFENKGVLPTDTVMFTNAEIMNSEEFCNIANQKIDEEGFLNNIIERTKKKFGNKCELISLQIVNGKLTVNFAYFLEKNENALQKLEIIKKFFISIYTKEEIMNLIDILNKGTQDEVRNAIEDESLKFYSNDCKTKYIDLGFSVPNYNVLMDALECNDSETPVINESFGDEVYIKNLNIYKTGIDNTYFSRLEEYGPADYDAMKCSIIVTNNIEQETKNIVDEYTRRSVIKDSKIGKNNI